MKIHFVLACAVFSLLGVFACGSDSNSSTGSPGAGGTGGGGGSGGTGGATTHTCAELATCCASQMFADAVAANSSLSPTQCNDISSGTNEPACNSLYNGYQLLNACP